MQKAILPCCAECRKPLPRCYICLLPLGCLNPYLELRWQVRLQSQSPPFLDIGGKHNHAYNKSNHYNHKTNSGKNANINQVDQNSNLGRKDAFQALLKQYHSGNRFIKAYEKGGGNSSEVLAQHALDYDSINSLGGLKFGESFTWCQRCQLGGHSHHILAWFEVYDECGVSDLIAQTRRIGEG